MAVPTLDLSVLEYFSPILTFILVWVFVFGIFQFSKVFGENRVLHGIIAFVIGIIFMFSADVTTIVMFITPWFTVFFIFAMFVLIFFKIFGATDSQIHNVISHHGGLRWTMIIICIVLLLVGGSMAFGQKWLGYTQDNTMDGLPANQNTGVDSSATTDYNANAAAVFFNPKVLGMLLILIIAVFTIKTLGDPMGKIWPPQG